MVTIIPGADEQIVSRAEIDLDTGVWNRSGFLAAAGPVFDLCRRLQRPVALVFFELRAATTGAPTSGHDELLKVAVSDRFRSSDVLGLVTPNRVAALLADCAELTVVGSEGLQTLIPPTPSDEGLALAIGVVHRATPEGTLEQLLDHADAHLTAVAPTPAGYQVEATRPWRTVGHARRTRTRPRARKR